MYFQFYDGPINGSKNGSEAARTSNISGGIAGDMAPMKIWYSLFSSMFFNLPIPKLFVFAELPYNI